MLQLVHLGHGLALMRRGSNYPIGAEAGPAQRRAGARSRGSSDPANGRAGIRVGPAENAVSCIPAIETPANIRAAEMATRELNAGYLTVMLEGRYTDAYLAQAGKDAPKHTPRFAHHLLPDRFCRLMSTC